MIDGAMSASRDFLMSALSSFIVSDILINAEFRTCGGLVAILSYSNNFGLYQNDEKLIPHQIINILLCERF